MLDPTGTASSPVEGRACGSCTLCCKVYDVPPVGKPAGAWCRHCTPGRGCGIWETRPDQCRHFDCLWLTQGWLGPEWKPERAKFVITLEQASRFMLVQVDPGAPKAWRAEPYYSQLRRWAVAAVPEHRLVVVFVNRSATVVLPERDLELGIVGPQDRILVRPRPTAHGLFLDVSKVQAAA